MTVSASGNRRYRRMWITQNKKWRLVLFTSVLVAGIFIIRSIWLLLSFENTTQMQRDVVDIHSSAYPTLYEYYTDGGIIKSGLTTTEDFLLNSKKIIIFSGAIHYFRIHPKLWRDRLRKARAAGLNTIDIYVPWNLHEPEKGVYDFGDGKFTLSYFLDIRKFLKTAQEEDLLVILRPGPYICSEWDLGGLPSYLLRDKNMKLRTSYTGFTERVEEYFKKLIPIVSDLQFIHGGPIIAFQVENEYGSFGTEVDYYRDVNYMKFVLKLMKQNNIKGLFFTSDSPLMFQDRGSIPGVLQTANFQDRGPEEIRALKSLQPDLPVFVAEYWSGWFDHWSEFHHTTPVEDFKFGAEYVFHIGGSLNFYMFHGGTNFGFMNGANIVADGTIYAPDVSSYDYDAPLSESGEYTVKYEAVKDLVQRYNPIKTKLPAVPTIEMQGSYGQVKFTHVLSLKQLIDQLPQHLKFSNLPITNMENLPMNGDSGQSYGLIAYCVDSVFIKPNSILKIHGPVHDLALVTVDDVLMSPPIATISDLHRNFGSWLLTYHELPLKVRTENETSSLCILVENMGRVNYGKAHEINQQRKGLYQTEVTLDGLSLTSWNIFPLEFKKEWIENLTDWKPFSSSMIPKGPHLVSGTFIVEDDPPRDTHLAFPSPWKKGFAFINGFNLGRYFSIGPTNTLYIPGPLLKTGQNKLIVFESYEVGAEATLTSLPDLGLTKNLAQDQMRIDIKEQLLT